MNADVVVHNLRLSSINLSLLFFDLLFDLSELILKWLYYLLSDALLLFKFSLAALTLSAPILVLLAHAVDVVCDEINRLSERIRALTQYLYGFLHKLYVALAKPALAPARHRARFGDLDAANLLSELFLLLVATSSGLLLRA